MKKITLYIGSFCYIDLFVPNISAIEYQYVKPNCNVCETFGERSWYQRSARARMKPIKLDWIQALENMTNPETPTNVFITEPHNKYIASGKYAKVADNNSCAGINKWFGDPSDFLLEELENHKKWQNIHGTESRRIKMT